MATGIVKFFNAGKGFGFITPTDENDQPIEGGKDIFVHMTGLKQGVNLSENDKVQYETEEGQKGLQAINVETI